MNINGIMSFREFFNLKRDQIDPNQTYVAFDGKSIINLENGELLDFENEEDLQKNLYNNLDKYSQFVYPKEYIEPHIKGGNLPNFKLLKVKHEI